MEILHVLHCKSCRDRALGRTPDLRRHLQELDAQQRHALLVPRPRPPSSPLSTDRPRRSTA